MVTSSSGCAVATTNRAPAASPDRRWSRRSAGNACSSPESSRQEEISRCLRGEVAQQSPRQRNRRFDSPVADSSRHRIPFSFGLTPHRGPRLVGLSACQGEQASALFFRLGLGACQQALPFRIDASEQRLVRALMLLRILLPASRARESVLDLLPAAGRCCVSAAGRESG